MMRLLYTSPESLSAGWIIEDYDELSSDLSIFVEIETFREEGSHFDPRAPLTYGSSRTIVRRRSYYHLVDEIELDGPPIYQDHGDVTLLIGGVGGKAWVIARLRDPADVKSTEEVSMKPDVQYTTQQIEDAILAAAEERPIALSVGSVRSILRILGEKVGWQRCDVSQLEKGDRIRVEHSDDSAEEAVVVNTGISGVTTSAGYLNNGSLRRSTIYRIPAPRKLPTEPGSIIADAVTKGGTRHSVLTLTVGGTWVGTDSDGGSAYITNPDIIKDWKTATLTVGE